MQKASRNPSRAIREKFRKRSGSLLKKADELAYMCQTDVYLILYRGNKFYTYSSTDRDDWPPSEEEMNRHYPLRDHRGPEDVRASRRTASHQDDGERSEQSEEPPINQTKTYPENLRVPKQTRILSRPPSLAILGASNKRACENDDLDRSTDQGVRLVGPGKQHDKRPIVIPRLPPLMFSRDDLFQNSQQQQTESSAHFNRNISPHGIMSSAIE
ncbi:MAG: hypothetical protein Q9228_001426 [Teloschistes exilis]